jgi:hypothetical protein
MDTKRLPEIIREMYRLIDELEAMFEGRQFTPDGHTVGSIGEAGTLLWIAVVSRIDKGPRRHYRDAICRNQSDTGRSDCSPP